MQVVTKGQFEFILQECRKHNDLTSNFVEVGDVLYSLFRSTPETFHMLNDWDEGHDNDPHWCYVSNQHSAIKFIKDTINKLKEI